VPPTRDRLDGFAAALMVVLCATWGVQQAAIKVAATGVPPILQAGLRSAGAVLLVAAWSAMRGVNLWERDGTLLPGLAAAALFSGEFALIYAGLGFTAASRGVLFLYTAPFLVALGARRWLPRERMGRPQWVGLGLAFAGVALLFGENLIRPAGRAWIGDLMILGAAAMWAATTLVIKASALASAAPEKILLYQLAGSALALPFASRALGEGAPRFTAFVVASLAFQIAAVASASYLAWFWLVRHYPATRLSSFSFLTPVMGVLAGALLLGESITFGVLLALGLVGAGIWIANTAR
jgi:drug/metabolite transporter (DMT)-like permease